MSAKGLTYYRLGAPSEAAAGLAETSRHDFTTGIANAPTEDLDGRSSNLLSIGFLETTGDVERAASYVRHKQPDNNRPRTASFVEL